MSRCDECGSELDDAPREHVDTRPKHADGTLILSCSFCGVDDTEGIPMMQGAVAVCCLRCARLMVREMEVPPESNLTT